MLDFPCVFYFELQPLRIMCFKGNILHSLWQRQPEATRDSRLKVRLFLKFKLHNRCTPSAQRVQNTLSWFCLSFRLNFESENKKDSQLYFVLFSSIRHTTITFSFSIKRFLLHSLWVLVVFLAMKHKSNDKTLRDVDNNVCKRPLRFICWILRYKRKRLLAVHTVHIFNGSGCHHVHHHIQHKARWWSGGGVGNTRARGPPGSEIDASVSKRVDLHVSSLLLLRKGQMLSICK